MNKQQQVLLLALLAACCLGQALASPFASSQDQDDEEAPLVGQGANRRQQQDDGELNDFGGSFKAPGYGASDSADQHQQQLEAQNFPNQRQQGPSNHHQALASENSENQADDDDEGSEADEDSAGSPAESLQLESGNGMGGRRGAMALARALAESSNSNGELQQPWLEGSGSHNHHQAAADHGELDGGLVEEAEIESAGSRLFGADSNIANAKIELSPQDKATAAGHHHHHGHYAHGWLKMGAETGKKGAFKWHDKHPVGGKGRR